MEQQAAPSVQHSQVGQAGCWYNQVAVGFRILSLSSKAFKHSLKFQHANGDKLNVFMCSNLSICLGALQYWGIKEEQPFLKSLLK